MADKSIITNKDKFIKNVLAIKENDFSKSILVPLFKCLGYDRVEFYGGQYELGKDIICWKLNELGDTELAIVQVKYYKPSAKSADKNSFSEIVNQLSQASENYVPNTNGIKYKPVKLYLVTPYQLDTRALETRLHSNVNLKGSSILIVDGNKLSDLVEKHIPDKFNEIVGENHIISDVMISTLNNSDLMNAMCENMSKDIADFYCDLDFAVGNITTRLFFNMSFKSSQKKFSLSEYEWADFKNLALHIQTNYSNVVVGDINNIDKSWDVIKQKNDSIQILIDDLHLKVDDLCLDEVISNITHKLCSEHSKFVGETTESIREVMRENADKQSRVSYDSKIKSVHKLLRKLQKNSIEIYNKANSTLLDNAIKAISEYSTINRAIDKFISTIKPIKYEVNIDGILLSNILENQKNDVIDHIIKIKSCSTNKKLMKSFISKCEKVLGDTNQILKNKYFAAALGLSNDQKFAQLNQLHRLDFSVHDLFDSGHNLALYGEAGAGKTTTLQMYAFNRLNKSNDPVFFIPLAKAFETIHIEYSSNIDYVGIIIDKIVNYINNKRISFTHKMFIDLITKNNVLIIFDGIDEIIDKVPWILIAIKCFHEKYRSAQLLVSSRLSGGYVEKMPFIGLTLLPFTDDQRSSFINSWLKNNELTDKVNKHLKSHYELDSIVRNPLLATVLCILCKHNISLPDSEVRIYEERFRLLFGLYDMHKKTNRVKSNHNLLSKIARKLAFSFHEREIRYTTRESIINTLTHKLNIDQSIIEIAIDDLILNCNILEAMTTDGQYGFGHFRFQEYLTACELIGNRGIILVQYLNRPSWRGALFLFSKMTDDIEQLLVDIMDHYSLSQYHDTLKLMISARPEKESKALMDIFDHNLEQDNYERNFLEADSFDYIQDW